MQLTDTQKENIKLWLTALRSGGYKQTQGTLQDENGFCCLGVACDVYQKQTAKGKWSTTADALYFNNEEVDGAVDRENISSQSILDFFGFDDVNGFQLPQFALGDKGTSLPIRLTEVNDALALTFPEIAELVERYVLNGEPPMTSDEVTDYFASRNGMAMV